MKMKSGPGAYAPGPLFCLVRGVQEAAPYKR